jgi:hypothetical protein
LYAICAGKGVSIAKKDNSHVNATEDDVEQLEKYRQSLRETKEETVGIYFSKIQKR